MKNEGTSGVPVAIAGPESSRIRIIQLQKSKALGTADSAQNLQFPGPVVDP